MTASPKPYEFMDKSYKSMINRVCGQRKGDSQQVHFHKTRRSIVREKVIASSFVTGIKSS